MARKRVSAGPNGRRIRVLHVQDKCGHGGSQIQGVQRLLLWWWPAFENTEFDLSLCILRGRNAASRSFDEAGIRVSYLGRSRFDPRTANDLVRLIREQRIDLVHCHGYGATTFGRIAGGLCKRPVIIHEHMIDTEIPYYQKLIDRLLAPWTTQGIAVSNAVGDFMTTARGLPRAKVEVVYNGIPESFCEGANREERRRVAAELGVSPGRPVIGIVGRLHPIKGQVEFVKAAAIVRERIPEAQFLVVGDGDFRSQLELIVEQENLETHVRFVGHRNDVRQVLSVLDILVISSHSEGFSLSAAEAMAAGKAVVAMKVGGIPEVIRGEQTGLLVPPRDERAMAAAIVRLIEDDGLRQELGSRAMAECQRRFLISGTVASLSRIYWSAVGARGRGCSHQEKGR